MESITWSVTEEPAIGIEEEAPSVSEEEEKPPVGVEVEEEPPPTSPPPGRSKSEEGGGAVRLQLGLELPTSCIRDGGGAVRRQLELPTSWREGGVAVRLEGEVNLPLRSQACLFTSSECLLSMTGLISQKIAQHASLMMSISQKKSKLDSNIKCKLKSIHNRINNT
jgi:hypothetical protein